MAVRDDEDISGGIGVFEALAVVVFPDVCDDCIETTDDVFGGSVLVSYHISGGNSESVSRLT